MAIDANLYPNSSGLVLNRFLGVFANTDTTDDSTGALQVWGGVAIKKNLYVGGNLVLQNTSLGNLTANTISVSNLAATTSTLTTLAVIGNISAANVSANNLLLSSTLNAQTILVSGNVQAANVVITGTSTSPLAAITRSEAFGLSILFGL
jgi:hypothetical protein